MEKMKMKKRVLNVKIEGVWYRVDNGKLHKIVRPESNHAAVLAAPAQRKSSSCTKTSCGSSGDQRLNPEFSPEREQFYRPAGKRASKHSIRHRNRSTQTTFDTSDMEFGAPRKRRITLRADPGAKKEAVRGFGVYDLCSGVGGSGKMEPFGEDSDPECGYESEESCQSTAASSAKRPLVIRLRMTKVTGE